jgi:hypothetical protein
VNRIVVDRQPLLLLVSSASLLALVLPARGVRGLPDRLGALVEARLRRCGIDERAIASERRAMHSITVATTVDRSVLGIMVDFARAVSYHLDPGPWTAATFAAVEDRLAENPCFATRPGAQVVFPDRKTRELLHAKWLVH